MSTDTRKWFKEAGYGMMIHWGLYSLLAGEWKDQKCGNYAEWIQTRCRIPISEYDKLATAFNPVYFNADEIVKFAKDCGMKYLVFTSKHHEALPCTILRWINSMWWMRHRSNAMF